ncbi:MAG: ABC transporter permease [Actinomycetota bacterium]
MDAGRPLLRRWPTTSTSSKRGALVVLPVVRGALRMVRRLVATVAGAALAVFVAIEISIPRGFAAVVLPGGIDDGSPRARAIVETYHLDDPVPIRFGRWVLDLLAGELGRSTRGMAVSELIVPRLSISLQLVLVSVLGTILLGIPLGLLAAAWSGRRRGTALNVVFGLSQSIPVFITPVFLIWLFALQLRWLPAAGWIRISDSLGGNLRNLLLPAAALVFAELGIVARIIRADALQVLRSEYIAAAVGKGLSPWYVLTRHALRPASLGLLNVVGLNVASLLSGAMVLEIVFGIGGLGQLVFEAAINRDLYLLLALTTYVVTVYVVLNSIVDVAMRLADPRI